MLSELNNRNRYLLHTTFWVCYYVLFSLIWVQDGDFKASFYLEFLLLPARMLLVYVTIYYLIPKFLLEKRIVRFLGFYIAVLIACSMLQRVILYFFYEVHSVFKFHELLNAAKITRAIILLNTTAVLVSSFKIIKLYFREKSKANSSTRLELKSSGRIYRIDTGEIEYVKGMGNYIEYCLSDNKKIVVYQSLKNCLEQLADNFVRVHRSYIINTNKVFAYDNESVETLSGNKIPLSKEKALIEKLV